MSLFHAMEIGVSPYALSRHCLLSGDGGGVKAIVTHAGMGVGWGGLGFLEMSAFMGLPDCVELFLGMGVGDSDERWGAMHCAFAGKSPLSVAPILAKAGFDMEAVDAMGGSGPCWANFGGILAWSSQRAWANGKVLSELPGRMGRSLWDTAAAMGNERAVAWWAAAGFATGPRGMEFDGGKAEMMAWIDTERRACACELGEIGYPHAPGASPGHGCGVETLSETGNGERNGG